MAWSCFTFTLSNNHLGFLNISKISTAMKSNFKKNVFQILLVLVIVVGIITLFKSGYKTGQWLYISTHSTK
jgi:hypothetical protein